MGILFEDGEILSHQWILPSQSFIISLKGCDGMKQTIVSFGETLAFYRKKKGYTQQQIADILGINRTTYTKYETAVSEPSIEMLRHLAQLLDVDFNELFGLTAGKSVVKDDDRIDSLSSEEAALIAAFRRLSVQQQEELLRKLTQTEE